MAPSSPVLVPNPRNMKLSKPLNPLARKGLIRVEPSLLFEAQTAQKALSSHGCHWEIVAGNHSDLFDLSLSIVDGFIHPQGYRISVQNKTVSIQGSDHAGVYYGVCTLKHLLQQYGRDLPTLEIADWPDYLVRGVLLDISRDKVPTMETLHNLVEQLASWKINQLQLYMEHTFAYHQYSEVWELASPITGQEIMELDLFCKQHHVELVPAVNSLGHMERWLKHPRHHDLAECPDGFIAPWGDPSPPSTLNPIDPRSLDLVFSMYDELLPHFTSNIFNIGGDEPWELGQCRSKDVVAQKGTLVYIEYLQKLHAHVSQHNRKMMFWGDIIAKHPELVPELPDDAIAMEWGYEANHDFETRLSAFQRSGISFYVCPGTSSWNSLIGRTDNAVGNLRLAATTGLKYGAIGFLVTDWGDAGHWQPLPVSYLGFAYGAAVSWCIEANSNLDLPAVLDAHVFRDRAGIMGQLVYDLGNVYQIIGPAHINGQVPSYVLQLRQDEISTALKRFETWGSTSPDISPSALQDTIRQINKILTRMTDSDMQRDDAALICDEIDQAANLIKHGVEWLLLIQGQSTKSAEALLTELDRLIAQQRTNWLARNRRGGLEDSMRRFEKLRSEYIKQLESTRSGKGHSIEHHPL